MTESVDDLLDELVEGTPEAARSAGMASGAGGSLSEGSEEAVGKSAGSGSALCSPIQGEPERAASDLRGETKVSDAALPNSPRSKDREGTQSNPKGGLPTPPDTYSDADLELGPKEKTQKARRGMARQRERSGRCPMYAPVGTVCKTCGKVHPL